MTVELSLSDLLHLLRNGVVNWSGDRPSESWDEECAVQGSAGGTVCSVPFCYVQYREVPVVPSAVCRSVTVAYFSYRGQTCELLQYGETS